MPDQDGSRAALEAELARIRTRLEATLHAVSDPIFEMDVDGRIYDFWASHENMLAVPPDQFMGRRMSDVLPAEVAAVCDATLRDAAIHGRAVGPIYRLLTPAGEGWFEPAVAKMPNSDPARFVFHARNVTDQVVSDMARRSSDQNAVRTVRAARDRLDAMLKAIPDLLFEVDDEDRIVDFRAADTALLKVEPSVFLGRGVAEVMPADAAQTILEALREARRDGRSFGHVYSLDMNGEQRWYELSIAREETVDGLHACITLARDITVRKRALRDLRSLNAELEQRVTERTARLEAANRELEAFTHSVSHDLKGPLRSIDGYCQILAGQYASVLDQDGQRMMQSMRHSVQQMHELINGLLAYSLIEREPFRRDTIALHEWVTSVAAAFTPELSARGIALTVARSPLVVTTDLNAITIALRNLLDNAIKFSSNVPSPTIDIAFEDRPTHVTVSVKDKGIGFDMKHHDRMFDIFRRLQADETYPGTGLGLAMVRKAMHRIGGRVWAESEIGHGATFYLEVPKSRQV